MLKKIRGKVENNPIFKFRQFWENLSEIEQDDMWNILSILRGEDGGSFYLKAETTGRIRAELFMGMRAGILTRLSKQVVVSPEICPDDEISELRKIFCDYTTSNHWKDHFFGALHSFSKYVYKRKIKDLFKITGIDRG